MLPKQPEPPAVQIRVRHVIERRRGGAWKVAYADFVTALMALFIVLWIMNSSPKVKASISGYFRDPRGYSRKLEGGPPGQGQALAMAQANVSDLQKQIDQALQRIPDFQKLRNNVKLSASAEGLRIFFETGSPQPTAAGERLLRLLAGEIGRMPNSVVIEGHTDARPFRNTGPSTGYSNWELSADRANAARRLLQAFGIHGRQVVEIRGYSDQKLLNAGDPNDPRNRRISLVVRL